MNLLKDITLLDTIGNTCIVQMPKGIFSRYFSKNVEGNTSNNGEEEVSFQFNPPLDPKEVLKHFNRI